jgi:hypothetical protein
VGQLIARNQIGDESPDYLRLVVGQLIARNQIGDESPDYLRLVVGQLIARNQNGDESPDYRRGVKGEAMAYDENLARRMRAELGPMPGLVEKKMFGGVGFLVRGNMACGIHGDNLIARVGPERYEEALARPHTRVFDMTGRPMSGWVEVTPVGVAGNDDLRAWVQEAVEYALSLPEK